MNSYRVIALVLSALLATGCATVDKTAFSPEAKKTIKTVAVIGVNEPDSYFLHPGMAPGGAALYMFGALGGLILGGIEASRAQAATNEFTLALKPTQPDVASHWNDSVLTLVQAKGYEATPLPSLPMKSGGKEVDCSSLAGKFDAVLLTTIATGYAVETATEPRVSATVKLLSGNCAKTYYADSFLYAAKPLGKLTHIERDKQFSFASRDALIADPQKAKDGLRTGLTEIAKKVAADL